MQMPQLEAPLPDILPLGHAAIFSKPMTALCACHTVDWCLQVPAPSLGHDMAQLLESGQAADVRFKVEGEELAAHKFILTARSPVFRSDV